MSEGAGEGAGEAEGEAAALRAEIARLRAALAREEAKRRAMMDHLPLGIVFTDLDLVYEEVNARHDEYTGLPAAEKLGRAIDAVQPRAAGPLGAALRRLAETGESVVVTGGIETPRGLRYYEAAYHRVADAGGVPIALLGHTADVTSRITRGRAEREFRQLIQGVLDSAQDGIVVWRFVRDAADQVADAVCMLANTAAARLYGVPLETLIGGRIRALFGRIFREDVFAAYGEVAATGVPYETTVHLPRPGVAAEHFRLRAAKVDDGVAVTITDLTGVTRAEAAVEAERARLRWIVDAVPVYIALADERFVVRVSNDQGRALTGMPGDAAIGRGLLEVLPAVGPALRSRLAALLATRRAFSLPEPLTVTRTLDGVPTTTHWDGAFIPRLGADGSMAGVLVYGVDVTERVEHQRREAAHLEELRRADRLKDEFLSVVSHELRTPVHIVTGYLELLLRAGGEPLTPGQRGFIEKAAAKTAHLAQVIGAVMDISQLEAGTLKLLPERVEPGAFLADALAPLADLARAQGLAVAVDLPDGLPVLALDPVRIRQVLTNLVGNAVKFTPPGGSIRVSAAARPGRLRVEVADTGTGIEPAAQDRVFERFAQADMTLTRRAGGVGLGLAIARQLVEAHGGAIGFTSAPGAGSTFWFELPAP